MNSDGTHRPAEPVTSDAGPSRSRRLKATAAAATAGLMAAAGVGGMVMTHAVKAADGVASASASTAPGASTAPEGATEPTGSADTDAEGNRGRTNEKVTDTSVVAAAVGIKEADLITALQGGQTIAAVAKANNVNVQVVIDALVKDKKDELAAAVTAGTITQAQADAEAAKVTQFATAQVNGSMQRGGRHEPDADDQAAAPPTAP